MEPLAEAGMAVSTVPATPPPTRPRHLDCVASSRPEPRGVLGDLVTARTAQHLLCTRRFPYVVNFLLGGFVLFSRSCARGLEGPGCPTALFAFSPEAEGLSIPALRGMLCRELPKKLLWPKLGSLSYSCVCQVEQRCVFSILSTDRAPVDQQGTR